MEIPKSRVRDSISNASEFAIAVNIEPPHNSMTSGFKNSVNSEYALANSMESLLIALLNVAVVNHCLANTLTWIYNTFGSSC
jgi:hypothetical protein